MTKVRQAIEQKSLNIMIRIYEFMESRVACIQNFPDAIQSQAVFLGSVVIRFLLSLFSSVYTSLKLRRDAAWEFAWYVVVCVRRVVRGNLFAYVFCSVLADVFSLFWLAFRYVAVTPRTLVASVRQWWRAPYDWFVSFIVGFCFEMTDTHNGMPHEQDRFELGVIIMCCALSYVVSKLSVLLPAGFGAIGVFSFGQAVVAAVGFTVYNEAFYNYMTMFRHRGVDGVARLREYFREAFKLRLWIALTYVVSLWCDVFLLVVCFESTVRMLMFLPLCYLVERVRRGLSFVIFDFLYGTIPNPPKLVRQVAGLGRRVFVSLTQRMERREARKQVRLDIRAVREKLGLKEVTKSRDQSVAAARVAKWKFVIGGDHMFQPAALPPTSDLKPVVATFPEGYATQTRWQKLSGATSKIAGAAVLLFATKKLVDLVVEQAGRLFRLTDREKALVAVSLLAADTSAVQDAGSQALSLVYDCVLSRSLSPLSEPAPVDITTIMAALDAQTSAYGVVGDSLMPSIEHLYSTMCTLKVALDARGGPVNPIILQKYVALDQKYRTVLALRQSKKSGYKPFIFHIHGPPGTGKSAVLARVYASVIDVIYGNKGRVDRDQVIDKIRLEDKFDSTSTPLTTIGHLDDAVMTGGLDGVACRALLTKIIWGASTGEPRIALKAAVEEKGVNIVHYAMIGWASNSLYNGIQPHETADAEAFARRVVTMKLGWVDEKNHPSTNESDYLSTEQPSWATLMQGRKLEFGKVVVDGLTYKFVPSGVCVTDPAMMMQVLRNLAISQVRSRLARAADKNLLCSQCWEYSCHCDMRYVTPALVAESALVAQAECGSWFESGYAATMLAVRGALSVPVPEVERPLAAVSTPMVVAEGDGNLLGIAGSVLQSAVGQGVVLPLTAVNVWRACAGGLSSLIALWFLPYWTMLFIILESVSSVVCLRSVNPLTLMLLRLHETITVTLWDFGAVVAAFWPSVAVPFLALARWRSSWHPGWVRAYTSAAVLRPPVWLSVGLAVALIGLWSWWRRDRQTTESEASSDPVEVVAPKPKPVTVEHVVGRVALNFDVVEQAEANKSVTDVVSGRVAELDEMKSLAEKVWPLVGTEVEMRPRQRVVIPTMAPISLGAKSKTATYAQLAGTFSSRDVPVSVWQGEHYVGGSHAISWCGEWFLMMRHGAPAKGPWSMKYTHMGEIANVELDGDVGEPFSAETGSPEKRWIAWSDALLVRVPGFTSSRGVMDYALTGELPELLGMTATVVQKGKAHLIGQLCCGDEGQMQIYGHEVDKGWSGSSVWVNIKGFPVFLGQVSRSSDQPSLYIECVTSSLIASKIKFLGSRVEFVRSPEIPAAWRVSAEIHEGSAIYYDGLRGSLVGVVTNLPKQKICWSLRDPLPDYDLGQKLWAARDLGHLVYDDQGVTGLKPVGDVGSRPVVWLDGFASTRIEMAKVQEVAGWEPAFEDHVVDVWANHIWKNSKLSGWTRGLSTEEAAFGVPGLLGGVNVASGAGPNFPGKVKTYVTKPLGLAPGRIDPLVVAGVDRWFDQWDQGVSTEVVSRVSVKAETRSMSKHICRNIFVFDVDLNLALKRIFGLLSVGIGSAPYRNGLLMMVNAASREFSDHFKGVHSGEVEVLDADKKTMDWSQNSKTWSALTKVYDALAKLDGATDEFRGRLRAALSGLRTGLFLVGRLLVYMRIGMGSGLWITSQATSLLEGLTVTAAAVLAGARVGMLISQPVFSTCVRPGVCGDDDCTMLLKRFVQKVKLTPKVFREVCEALGFRVTAGDKTELEDNFASKQGLRFLKRSLDVLDDGTWRAGCLSLALPVESMFKSMYVVESSMLYTPKMHADVISNAWREAWLLPLSEGNEVRRILTDLRDRFVAMYGVPVVLMEECDFRGKWEAGTFVTYDSQ